MRGWLLSDETGEWSKASLMIGAAGNILCVSHEVEDLLASPFVDLGQLSHGTSWESRPRMEKPDASAPVFTHGSSVCALPRVGKADLRFGVLFESLAERLCQQANRHSLSSPGPLAPSSPPPTPPALEAAQAGSSRSQSDRPGSERMQSQGSTRSDQLSRLLR